MNGFCQAPGCQRFPVKSRGLCSPCYEKWRRGNPNKKKRMCKVAECKDEYFSIGYCCRHYYQKKRNGKITMPGKRNTPEDCSIIGCIKKHRAKGLCSGHYNNVVQHITSGISMEEAVEKINQKESKPPLGRLELIKKRHGILKRRKNRGADYYEWYRSSNSRDDEITDPLQHETFTMET